MENNSKEVKDLIRTFIHEHKIGIISTVTSEGNPEAAVIEFGETKNLELIFDTFATYRKFKNLQYNQHVAFVVGWDNNITVQYEGIASELIGKEQEKYKKLYFAKNPKAQKWEGRPEIRYFKVKPTWIRYSDLNVNPWEIHEVTFKTDKYAERKKYNKLVRDLIPEYLDSKGIKSTWHIADEAEYKTKLIEKLGEEVAEFKENINAEELADLLEVIDAIIDYKQINRTELEKVKIQKTEKRGKFTKRIILDES